MRGGLKYAFGERDISKDVSWSEFVLRGPRRGPGKSAENIRRLALSKHLLVRTAIYVAGPESGGPIKIGISGSPAKRLIGLQVAFPWRLKFHHLSWVANEGAASMLEEVCHKRLKRSGAHLSGEWFNITPRQAASIIDIASLDIHCHIVPHRALASKFSFSEDPLSGLFWDDPSASKIISL